MVRNQRAQKLVLAYFIKSERANQQQRHTILLTPDNNHYLEIRTLEQAGLIEKHPDSPPHYPVYLADRELMKENYNAELRVLFGEIYDTLNQINKDCLNVVYRHQYFSRMDAINAKQVGLYLWAIQGERDDDIRGFDNFTRKLRSIFSRLLANGLVVRKSFLEGYFLNTNYKQTHLL